MLSNSPIKRINAISSYRFKPIVYRTTDDKLLLFGNVDCFVVEKEKDKVKPIEQDIIKLLGIYDDMSNLRAGIMNIIFADKKNIIILESENPEGYITADLFSFLKQILANGVNCIGSGKIEIREDELFYIMGDKITDSNQLEGLESQLKESRYFQHQEATQRLKEGYDIFSQDIKKMDEKTRVFWFNKTIERSRYTKKEREQAEKFLTFIDNYTDLAVPECFDDEEFIRDAVEILSMEHNVEKKSFSKHFATSLLNRFFNMRGDLEKKTLNITKTHSIPESAFRELFLANDMFIFKYLTLEESDLMVKHAENLVKLFPKQIFSITQDKEVKEKLIELAFSLDDKKNEHSLKAIETLIYGYGKTEALNIGNLEQLEFKIGAKARIQHQKKQLKEFASEQEENVVRCLKDLSRRAWFKDTYKYLPQLVDKAIEIHNYEKKKNPYYNVTSYFTNSTQDLPTHEAFREAKKLGKEELEKKIKENPKYALTEDEYRDLINKSTVYNILLHGFEDVAIKYIKQGQSTSLGAERARKNREAIEESMIRVYEAFNEELRQMPHYDDLIQVWSRKVPGFKEHISGDKNIDRLGEKPEKTAVLTTKISVNFDLRKMAEEGGNAKGIRPRISQQAKENASKKYKPAMLR
ncbi:MAG TPA: hypothetical protein ENN12_04845 [Epsilonproteobacteria bacterium]|nr:hypothetical protein [Campylobacterota bacterium]